ncbi:hypothetical protein [Xanthomonas sp. D-109]|uniref:hypothetical protein n=1 Tax=Xanthomonas sp. D-109 TaxID=2821274 RepID=UPI001ADBBC7F|nr:hypothetical protein [Xanthomonas sp. D-109]MBO9881318.1 hypothetical protein [Xanthomonas sp. D-109]
MGGTDEPMPVARHGLMRRLPVEATLAFRTPCLGNDAESGLDDLVSCGRVDPVEGAHRGRSPQKRLSTASRPGPRNLIQPEMQAEFPGWERNME